MRVTNQNWAGVHSQTWPMTPYESQYGYTAVVAEQPLLARSFGAPVMGGGKRRRRRRQMRRERRLRAQARRRLRMDRTGMAGLFDTIFGGGSKDNKETRGVTKVVIGPGGKETTTSAPASSGSTGGAAPGRGGVLPPGAESVPAGRDPATYFRTLGFTRGQARDLARERNLTTRRQMMDRFSYRNRPRGGGGGGGFAAFSSALGGLFGQGREAAQSFDFGGGGGTPAAESPAPSGMSTGMIAALAAAGLGAVYLATQAGS